jgi:FkbM family methyltransferase
MEKMKRGTRIVSIKNTPMVIFEGPETISDDIVKYNNFWEFELFNKWSKHFPTEGLMLDIGANIGSQCVQFKVAFPNLKIWAFEPFPENFDLLKQNTQQFEDVHVFNVGVGSSNSMVHFGGEAPNNSGVIRVVEKSNNTNLVLSLDTLTIPEPVKMIKIDIEGHELSAFEGMKQLLLKDKPLIWLEDLTLYTNPNNAVSYLKTLGYNIIEQEISSCDFLMKI